jgi:hypothetical protein
LETEGPAEQDTLVTFYDETDVNHGYQDSHKDSHENRKAHGECNARENSEDGSGSEKDTDAPQGGEGPSARTGETSYDGGNNRNLQAH